jgi:hypothetical protein
VKVCYEVDRVELFRLHQNDEQLRFLCIGFCKRHCYQVELDQDEFQKLIVNSSPTLRHPTEPKDFPLLKAVLTEIENNQNFLADTDLNGGLSGTKVQEKIEQFNDGEDLDGCFIIDAEDLLPGRTSEYYVIDGMHRLVAYGIWSKLDKSKYPISIYHCTDKEFAGC